MSEICDWLATDPTAIIQLGNSLMANKIISKPMHNQMLQDKTPVLSKVSRLINYVITQIEINDTNAHAVVSTLAAIFGNMGYEDLAEKISERCSKHIYIHMTGITFLFRRWQKQQKTILEYFNTTECKR